MNEFNLLPDKIKSKINIDSDSGCWRWSRYKDEDGYGRVGWQGRRPFAHRVVYELLRGPIPDGLVCDHYRNNPGERFAPCDRACVNPSHIEICTVKENINRGRLAETHKGNKYCLGNTWNRGEKQVNSKLITKQVLEIRRLYAAGGITYRELAIQFGVSQAQIRRIVLRKQWAHI